MAQEDHDSLWKLIHLYDRLQAGAQIDIRTEAENLGVDKRTVQRYLAKLREAGVRLEDGVAPSRGKVFRLPQSSRGFTAKLKLEQVVALHVALGWLKQFEGNVIFESLDILREQVVAWLEDRRAKEREGLRWVAQKFYALPFLPFAYDVDAEVFDDVVTSLLREQKLRIAYVATGGQRRTHVVRPYTLLFTKGAFYLVALVDHARPGYRPTTWHLSRIAASERLREGYEYPRDWDPASLSPTMTGLLDAEVADLAVSFDPRFHRHLAKERRWPAGARVTREGDRSVLRARLPLSEELVDWLLGFTPPVEILSPPALRDRLVARARAVLEVHGER